MSKKRTLAIALITTTASFGLAKHAAHAALNQQLSRIGHALEAFAPDTPDTRDRLDLNGAHFEVHSEVTGRSPDHEIERFTHACDAAGEGSRGVGYTWPDGETKVSVCLAPPPPAVSSDALTTRVARAAASGDLSDVGELRMLRAMPTEMGSALVHLRGLGAVSLRDMLPREGDAAGSDMPGLPRPASSRRLLSVLSDSKQQGVAVYEATGSVIEVRAAYRARLEQSGVTVGLAQASLQALTPHGNAYVIGFRPSAGRTQVAIAALDLVRPDHPPAAGRKF